MHLRILRDSHNKYGNINRQVFVMLTDCAIGTKVIYNLDKNQFSEHWYDPPMSLVFHWSSHQNFIAYPPNIVELSTLIIVTSSELEYSSEQIYNTIYGFGVCSTVNEWSCRISDLSLHMLILLFINNCNISDPANLC